jgi:hypothetical protein
MFFVASSVSMLRMVLAHYAIVRQIALIPHDFSQERAAAQRRLFLFPPRGTKAPESSSQF